MAQILEAYKVPDGYDIKCLLSNEQTTVFHFPTQPEDAQARVDELEIEFVRIQEDIWQVFSL